MRPIIIRPAFHILGVSCIFYAIMINDTFNWFGILHNLRVLTIWNLWILFFFFLLSTIYDIVLGLTKSSPRFFREILSDCFNAYVFPISIFISIVFVVVFLLDGDLPYNWFIDWRNQLRYAVPSVLVIAERCITYHPYLNVRSHLIGLLLLTVLYQMAVMLLRSTRGSWAYLFLDSYLLNSRMVFFLALLPILSFIYFVGSRFNHRIWDESKRERSVNVR